MAVDHEENTPSSAPKARLKTPTEWRSEFFHSWLREHVPDGRGRCVQKRCHVERARHPCQMRERAVTELARDGHIADDQAEAVLAGLPCCELSGREEKDD